MSYLGTLFLAVCLFILQVYSIRRANMEIDFHRRAMIEDTSGKSNYFGLTLALFESRGGQGWIFIGAPKANDTTLGGVSQPGKIWRCSLSSTQSCVVVNIGDALCSRKASWNSGIYGNICRGMFLGGALTATNDKLIACAPRWGRLRGSINDPWERMDGACYWIHASDALQETIQFPPPERQLVIPFADQKFSDPAHWLTEREGIPRWFFGEFGTSAHLSRIRQEFIAGAAGVLTGDGGVVLSPLTSRTSQDAWKWKMFHFERTLPSVHALHSGNLGYAVTSGCYFFVNVEMVAASAPRSQGSSTTSSSNYAETTMLGSVLIMWPRSAEPSENIWRTERGRQVPAKWQPDVELIGHVFGSYFGASLASVDINNDGLDELFVGAPLESGTEDSGDCDFASGDNGRVYIYSHKWSPRVGKRWNYARRLCGTYPRGRFGTSIAPLADIDYDGYNDFAVGAPYEGVSGAVYVYFGRGDNRELAHIRIVGSKAQLRPGFGYSVTGGIDLDGNATPDFAVGDYLGQSITVFRTRPKLDVTIRLYYYRHIPLESPITLRLHETQFKISLCVGLNLYPLKGGRQNAIELWGRLSVDSDLNRFGIKEGPLFPLSFEPWANTTCVERLAIRSSEIKGELEDSRDIPVSVQVWYNKTSTLETTVSISTIEVDGMNRKLPMSGPDYESFCSECPYPMTRTFEGSHYNVPFAIDCMRRGDNLSLPVCQPDIHVSISRVELAETPITGKFVLGNGSDLTVVATVRNENQTAYRPVMQFSWEWIRPRSSSGNLIVAEHLPTILMTSSGIKPCGNPTSSKQQVCQVVQELLRRHKQKALQYSLSLEDVVGLTRKPLQLSLNSTVVLESDPYFKPVSHEVDLDVIMDASINVTSPPIVKKLPWSATSPLSPLFQVKLIGVSPVKVRLFVGLPTSVTKTKSGEGLITVTPPESWCVGWENSTWPGVSKLKLQQLNINTAASVNCLSTQDTQRCKYFYCEGIVRRGSNRIVDARFNMQIAKENEDRLVALVGQKGKVVALEGFAYANIFDEDSEISSDHSVCLFQMVLNPADNQGIAAWIIVVSAVGGMLILSCLIFALCQCGFFKRKKKEQLELLLKAEAENDDGAAAGQEVCGKAVETQKGDPGNDSVIQES